MRVEEETGGEEEEEEEFGERQSRGQKTVVCSCLGVGYRNMARAST